MIWTRLLHMPNTFDHSATSFPGSAPSFKRAAAVLVTITVVTRMDTSHILFKTTALKGAVK